MDKNIIDFDFNFLDNKSGNELMDKPFLGDKDVRLIVEGLNVRSLKIALRILDVAQTKVPVDTGFLKSTGKVVQLDNGYEVVYESPYAIYVHEGVGNRFKVGQAKFLEEAYYEVIYSGGNELW